MLINSAARLFNLNNKGLYNIILIFCVAYFVANFPIYSYPYFYFYGIEFLLIWLYIRLGSNYFFYFAFFYLVFFGGSRLNVGVDYESYNMLFDRLYESNGLPLTEPFTYFIIKAVKGAGFSNSVIFLIYSFVTIIGIYKLIKLSPDRTSKALSFFIFLTFPIYFLASLNQIRQWAAIGVSCYSLYYLIEGKRNKFLLSVLIAACFHLSALFILTYVFFAKRFNFYRVVFFILSLLIVSKLAFNFIEYTPYSMYLMEDGLRFEGGNYTALYVYLMVMILFIVKLNYFNNNDQITLLNVILGNMSLCSIAVISTGLFLSVDFLTIMRLNAYLIINLILVIPVLIKQTKRRGYENALIFLIILFGLLYCFYTLIFNGAANKLVPYNFVFLPGVI